MIVDDRLLRLGSANLSNRSMGLDTECDLALDAATGDAAGSPTIRRTIERFLHRLLGHYMEAAPQEVERAIAREGSLGGAIEALRRPDTNHLQRWRPGHAGLARSLIAAYHLGDPQDPADSFRPWRRRRGPLAP